MSNKENYIRVLVISDYSRFHPSRCEAVIYLALAKKNFDIHIMTFGGSPHESSFIEAGIRVIDFHPVKRMDRQEIAFVKSYLVEHKIDIIHLYNSRAILNGIQAAKNLDVKIVLYRGLVGQVHWYNPIMYLKFLHPSVDKIVCNSKGVKASLDRQLFFDNKKAVVINKGHLSEWYEAYEKYNVQEILGLSQESFLLINVAVNRKMKGIPYLLKAMELVKTDKDIHLVLIGSNMDTPENLRFIEQHELTNVHILGYKEDALNYVSGCDVFVLTSIGGESITKAVIESMSLGTPAIITDISGNEELVDDDINGKIVPSKNAKALAKAIQSLYANKEEIPIIGKAAKEKIADKINLNNTVEAIQDLYEDLMKNRDIS